MTTAGWILRTLNRQSAAVLDHAMKVERDTLIVRLLALAIATATLYFMPRDIIGDVSYAPPVVLALAYLAYTIVLGKYVIPWLCPKLTSGKSLAITIAIMVLVDTVALTALLYMVGGPRTVPLVLLPLFIIYHSLYLGYLSSLLSATLFSIFYVGFGYLWGETEYLKSYIALQVPFFYLLAVFGGHLAEKQVRAYVGSTDEPVPPSDTNSMPAVPATALPASLPTSTLQEIVSTCSQLTGLRYCLLATPHEKQGHLAGRVANIDPADLYLSRIEELVFACEQDSPTARVIQTGHPIIIANMSKQKTRPPGWSQLLGAEFMLIMPLTIDGTSWGVMYLLDSKPRAGLGAGKMNLARSYARVAAATLADAVRPYQASTRAGPAANPVM